MTSVTFRIRTVFFLIVVLLFAGWQCAQFVEQHEQRQRWREQHVTGRHGSEAVAPDGRLPGLRNRDGDRRSRSPTPTLHSAVAHARPTDTDGGAGGLPEPPDLEPTARAPDSGFVEPAAAADQESASAR